MVYNITYCIYNIHFVQNIYEYFSIVKWTIYENYQNPERLKSLKP